MYSNQACALLVSWSSGVFSALLIDKIDLRNSLKRPYDPNNSNKHCIYVKKNNKTVIVSI